MREKASFDCVESDQISPGVQHPGIMVSPDSGDWRLVLVVWYCECRRSLIYDSVLMTTSRLCLHGEWGWKLEDVFLCRP